MYFDIKKIDTPEGEKEEHVFNGAGALVLTFNNAAITIWKGLSDRQVLIEDFTVYGCYRQKTRLGRFWFFAKAVWKFTKAMPNIKA